MLGPHSITRQRAPIVADTYSNRLPDWSGELDTLDVIGCSVQPVQGSTDFTDRQAATWTFDAWVPAWPSAPDIEPSDRIAWRDKTFVQAAPADEWLLGSPIDHLVLHLREVSG